MIRHRFVAAAALLAATGAAACATDGLTAPAAPTAANPALLDATTDLVTGTVTGVTSWANQTLSSTQLNRILESEKQRIAREQEDSKPTYDALKVVWERQARGGSEGLVGATVGTVTTTAGTVVATVGQLLTCDPLQYAADTKIIGPEGGDMSVGPHKLSIPKGALANRTVITAEMPTALEPQVRFSPHGLTFQKGVKLQMSYKHCVGPKADPKSLVYVNDALQILEWPLTTDHADAGLADGTINHFSGYAVAWSRSRQ